MTNATARDFLVALFPEWPAGTFAEIRAFQPGKKGEPPKRREWVRTATALLNTSGGLSPTLEVYYGINLRRGHNGEKGDVAYVGALHADIDRPPDEALEALARFPLPPSVVVKSGGGLHTYWLLKEPYEIGSASDAAYIESANKGLAHALGGDTGAWDISRVLRVPGTISHKHGGAPVELVELHPDRRYNVSDFEEWSLNVQNEAQPVSFGADADAEAALRKARPLTSEVRRLITEGHQEGTDRSGSDFRVCCDLVRAGLSDDEVRAIFQHYPIGEKYHGQGQGDRYLALTLGKVRAEVGAEEKTTEGQAERDETAPRLRRVRASELLSGEPYTPEYLPLLGMDGFIVKGWSHIVAAYPKTGKTELITDAVLTWVRQGVCVLYFTEEPEDIWRLRLAQRAGGLDGLVLVPAMGAGVDAVLAEVERAGEPVIVIDTTRQVLGLQDEKDNSEVARVLGPIIAACRERKQTLAFLHHHIKAGGQHGRGIAGGHAFLGIVDIALELERGNTPNQRVLKGVARVIEVPDLVYERDDAGEFVSLGAPQVVAFEELKGAALEALTEDWRPTKEVLVAMGEDKPSENRLRDALTTLVNESRAEREPPLSEKGGRGVTYRWRRNDA